MHAVVELADVAGVVEQRGDQRHDRPLGAEAPRRIDRELVADQEPRHGERHVERMLAIVINGVDAVITRHAAGEQALEFLEGDRDAVERLPGPGGREKFAHRVGYRRRGADLDGIRNVEVVTA